MFSCETVSEYGLWGHNRPIMCNETIYFQSTELVFASLDTVYV